MLSKEELRYKLKIKRKYFQGIRREYADLAIRDDFIAAFKDEESFFIYNSFSTEADTSGIIKELVDMGKRVYIPRVEGENIVPVPYGGKLAVGAFGIGEPEGQAYTGDIDVTIVPLLAINNSGFRTGYGKGFYDRYLKTAKTKKVGLGYSFQIEDFKEDGWDEPLDMFLCEKGFYYYGK